MDGTSVLTRLKSYKTNIEQKTFTRLQLVFLFSVSFFIHLFIVVLFINQPIALDDMFQYDMLARSIKEGNGFRWYAKADVEILRAYYAQFLDMDHLDFPEKGLKTAFRAPGYPVFLSILYYFISDASRFMLTRFVQAGLAALLAPLVVVFSRQLGFSKKACLLACFGISFYPILLFYPIGLASENLYIPLGLLSVLLIYFSTQKRSLGWVVLPGVVCGITMLTRSIFSVFVLLSAVWLFFFNPYQKKAVFLFLLTAFGFCLPWSIRNSIIMGKPSFVENSLGYNMFIGYHPEGDGGFVSKIAILPMNILDDGEREMMCLQQAFEFIRGQPVESMQRVLIRAVKFLGPEDREFFYFYSNNLIGVFSQPWLLIIYSLLIIPWGLTLIFGISGLWLSRNHPLTLLSFLFLIGYGLPHLFIIAEPRFHLAWVPLLLSYAVHGWLLKGKILSPPMFKKENLLILIVLMIVMAAFLSGIFMNMDKLMLIMQVGGNELRFSY